MNKGDTGRSSHDSVVLPPSLPDTKDLVPSDYVFNSVGFYNGLKERLESQGAQMLEVYARFKRRDSS
jgi:hypothetical protein